MWKVGEPCFAQNASLRRISHLGAYGSLAEAHEFPRAQESASAIRPCMICWCRKHLLRYSILSRSCCVRWFCLAGIFQRTYFLLRGPTGTIFPPGKRSSPPRQNARWAIFNEGGFRSAPHEADLNRCDDKVQPVSSWAKLDRRALPRSRLQVRNAGEGVNARE